MEEKQFAIALSVLKGIGATGACQLYKQLGSARAVYEQRQAFKAFIKNTDRDWDEALKRAEQELAFCEKNAIRVLTPLDEDYPQLLFEAHDAPVALFYKGNASLNVRHTLAIVGTRHITEYGKEICQRFCTDLSRILPDSLIVSGLAYGVDIHAHRACLQNGLPTVGILAHGLDRIYPAMHRNTAAAMVHQGGLLTEFPTGTNPDKGNFVRRNRIVAMMSAATLVVESAAKGGSLITAKIADSYGREVYAFPGRVGDKYSEGCNQLIVRKKGTIITSAEDLAYAQGWIDEIEKRKQPVQQELFLELDGTQGEIYKCLKDSGAMSMNQLSTTLQTPIQAVSAALFDMEMDGIVKQASGGLYKLVRQ
ncbi:MAG: DNA-processing protein DprA [Alloprevotella sp.]